MVLENTLERGAPVSRRHPAALFVGDDVLHVLRCGTASAAAATLAEWMDYVGSMA